MTITRRYVLIALLFGLTAPIAPAFAQATSKPPERLKIRVALSGSISEGLGYRIAKAQGYLEDENLEVDEQYVEARTLARDAVANGQVDVTNIGITTALRAIELGRPIQIVGGIFYRNPIYVIVSGSFLQRQNVSKATFKSWTPQERVKFLLDNKARWSSSTPGSLTDFASQNQLKYLGIDVQKDIEIKYFPTPANATDAFFQGHSSDVVIISEVYTSRLARLLKEKHFADLPLVFSPDEMVKHVPTSLVPGEQWVANIKTVDPVALTRFLRAYLRGTNYFLTKTVKETTAVVLKSNPDVISNEAKTALEESIAYNYRTIMPNGKLTDEQIKAAVSFSLGLGQIKGSLTPAQVADFRLVEIAAKGLTVVTAPVEAGQ